ncbi:MAG TPA: hypothetical protein PKO09_17970 [Anaerolineae bacterium]|nr:hypothetical protein [Anaerolineae bacterium]
MQRNPEMPGVWTGVGLGLAGLLLILVPPLARLDMMGLGFALQFLGLFLVIAGLVTALLFGQRARRLNALLGGEKLLAHWVYAPEQLRTQAERDFRQTRQRNRTLFLIVVAWMVPLVVLFVALGLWEGEGENMPLFVAIMAGVLLVVGAFAWGMPYLLRRRAMRSSGEAYIAANALFVNGTLHTWGMPLAGMDGVEFVEDGGPARLLFHLRSLSKASATLYDSYTVEVPVPSGQEATARRIDQHFQAPA